MVVPAAVRHNSGNFLALRCRPADPQSAPGRESRSSLSGVVLQGPEKVPEQSCKPIMIARLPASFRSPSPRSRLAAVASGNSFPAALSLPIDLTLDESDSDSLTVTGSSPARHLNFTVRSPCLLSRRVRDSKPAVQHAIGRMAPL